MRSQDVTQGQLDKASSGWFGGCNSNRNPWILDDSMFPQAVNVVNRGGVIQTRPGYMLGLTLPPGNLQGFAVMAVNKQDANGNVFENGDQFMVFAVSGLVYATPFPLVQPDKLTDWTQYQLTNLQFNPDAKRVYFCVAQKSLTTVGINIQLNTTYNVLMMQDGINPAAFWDGDLNLHLNEDSPDNATPTGTWMAFSGNRLWVARDNALLAGDLLDPLSFKERISGSTQGDFILPDTITGLVNTVGYTFQSQLIAFTQDQTFAYLSSVENRETWSSTANFQTILYPSLGCVAGLSIVNHAGLLWWYAKGGLVSFNSATTAYLTSRVKYQDNEMVNWTSKMYEDKSGICANSFQSYLSISIPSDDVFNGKTMVLDYSVADELNSEAPAAWQGVWTGIRPVNWISILIESTGQTQSFALSVDYEPLNGSHNHIWIAFQDDRTDSFNYKDPSNTVLTARNPIYCSFETKLLGDGLDLKVFRFLNVNLMELSGDVNFKASYRGTRGAYKELINKRIIAITDAWQTSDPDILALLNSGAVLVPQTRRLTSEVQQPQNLEQTNTVEFPYDDSIDRCYSIYFQWCGRAAIEAVEMIIEPFTEKPSGNINEDETYLNIVNQDGSSEAFPPSELASTRTVSPQTAPFNFQNNLFNRPFTPRYRDVYYSSIPPINTIGLGDGCITCLPCARDNYPPVTFDPTTNDEGSGYGPPNYIGNTVQSYTAVCPHGTTGAPATVTIPVNTYFALTQESANAIAFGAAVSQANAQLVCVSLVPAVSNGTNNNIIGSAVNYQIIATNSPTSYGATNLPAGLSLNSTTGLITGTISSTTPATYNVGLSATNAYGTGTGTLTITTTLPALQVTFSQVVETSLPVTFQVAIDGGAYANINFGTTYRPTSSIKWKMAFTPGTYNLTGDEIDLTASFVNGPSHPISSGSSTTTISVNTGNPSSTYVVTKSPNFASSGAQSGQTMSNAQTISQSIGAGTLIAASQSSVSRIFFQNGDFNVGLNQASCETILNF